MSTLEITLLIIGILMIVISCILVDKAQKAPAAVAGNSFSLENSITEEDKKQLKNKIDELLSDVSEEVMVRTDDNLSRLSNEKIMAVNEFSEQILEKIKRNHEEVVFLYNMLNDKEKELKEAVREIDSSKKIVQDIIELKSNSEKQTPSKEAKAKNQTKPAAFEEYQDKAAKKAVSAASPAKGITDTVNTGDNNNSQILALYSEGKSIMEISKQLGLGQGEVKLVIDLFKGRK